MNPFQIPELRFRARLLSRVILAGGAVLGGIAAAQTLRVEDLAPSDTGDHVRIRAEAPEGARVVLQRQRPVPGAPWETVGEPVFATASGVVHFLVPRGLGEPEAAYYRTLTQAYPMTFSDDGRRYVISVPRPTPAASILGRLRRLTGADLFLAEDVADPGSLLVPAFSVEGENLDEVLEKAGLPVRVQPDPDETKVPSPRFVIRLDAVPEPAGAPGRGQPTDDQPPDSTKPSFPEPVNPVPPRDDNMVAGADGTVLPDGASPADVPPDPEPGRHLRLHVRVRFDGSMALERALECRGDAERGHPQGALEADDFVVVFRSPLARTNPANIYGIRTIHEPFLSHRHGAPPDDSPHFVEPEALLRIPLPVLEADVDLSGLVVEVYRVTGEIEEGTLTPEVFLRQLSQVQAVGSITGAEIQRIRTVPGRGRAAAPAGEDGMPDPELKVIREVGPRSKKYNIVFIGDGFADTAADQKRFDDWVREAVVRQSFGSGLHLTLGHAFNLYQVSTFSKESGVTRVNGAGVPIAGQKRTTALGMQYSGNWDRCWIEGSLANPISKTRIHNVLEDTVPEWDLAVIVINVDGPGGCSKGDLGFVYLTLTDDVGQPIGSNWHVIDHELGHGIADLGDEYDCDKGVDEDCKKFVGLEPKRVNLTKRTQRGEIKWRDWIPWWRPVPTALGDVGHRVLDVGLFPGATARNQKFYAGIHRPSFSGVMDNDFGGFNPVGDSRYRTVASVYDENPLSSAVSGRFTLDGRIDLFHVNGRKATLYRSDNRFRGPVDPALGDWPRAAGVVLQPSWEWVGPLRNAKGLTWVFSKDDQVYPGDFDGDGRTDLYVYNWKNWKKRYVAMLKATGAGFEPVRIYESELPGWALQPSDHPFVGDFNGDGKADLALFNGLAWNYPHFAILHSTGSGLSPVAHYIQTLPGAYTMGRHDQFRFGDLNGDGRTDFVVFNKEDWQDQTLGLFTAVASGGVLGTRQYGYSNGSLRLGSSGKWVLRAADQYLLADVDGGGGKELLLYNGKDWAKRYLVVMRLVGNALEFVKVHENAAGGWKFAPNDLHQVGDFDHDGREDLLVVNTQDFNGPYLGTWLSTGGGNFTAYAQKAPIGLFNLAPGTRFHVGDFNDPTKGFDDLIAIRGNDTWLLRSTGTGFVTEAYYPGWIVNHRYHAKGYW